MYKNNWLAFACYLVVQPGVVDFSITAVDCDAFDLRLTEQQSVKKNYGYKESDLNHCNVFQRSLSVPLIFLHDLRVHILTTEAQSTQRSTEGFTSVCLQYPNCCPLRSVWQVHIPRQHGVSHQFPGHFSKLSSI